MKCWLLYVPLIVFLGGCLGVDRVKWLEVPVKEKGVVIRVDYVAPGATGDDVVQVSKRIAGGELQVLQNIKPYDTLLGYDVMGDTVLRLVLCDTAYQSLAGRVDTVLVRID